MAPLPKDNAALDAAVAGLIESRMDILKATLRARAAFLRGQAALSDSKEGTAIYGCKADEVEFLLGLMDKQG